MPERWGHLLVPRDLTIIVRMHIHPGRGDEETIGVDNLLSAAEVLPHGCDSSLGNRHISDESGFSGSVYNLSATNHYVMHKRSPFFSYVYGNLIVLYYKSFYLVAVNHTGLTKLLNGWRDLGQ